VILQPLACSPDGAQRNPGAAVQPRIPPDCTSFHPGDGR
jgi:hypothetical protein